MDRGVHGVADGQNESGMPDVRKEPVEPRMEMLLQNAIVRFP
jgi:hypothetical protein